MTSSVTPSASPTAPRTRSPATRLALLLAAVLCVSLTGSWARAQAEAPTATDALELLAAAVHDPWSIERALVLPQAQAAEPGSAPADGPADEPVDGPIAEPSHTYRVVVEAGGTTHTYVVGGGEATAAGQGTDAVTSAAGGSPAIGRAGVGGAGIVRAGAMCRIPSRDAGVTDDMASALVTSGAPVLDAPRPHAPVAGTLVVRGAVSGSWLFEGDLPVRLIAADGRELASAPAVAQGSWMTEAYVPFRAELQLEGAPPDGAMLVLERANPSGLARNAGFLLVPLGCGG